MALIPENDTELLDNIAEEETEVEPSRTYVIDFENGRIGRLIDGEQAIRQFIRKALLTTRSKFTAYTDDYGSELEYLIGEDVTDALLEAEVPRMVEEAIGYDDRIDEIQTTFEREGDKLFITVTVTTFDSDNEIVEDVTVDV